MQYIKRIQKELIILTIGFLSFLMVALFIYNSLTSISRKTNLMVQKEINIQANIVKNNVLIFLNRNKNIMNKAFINSPKDKKTLTFYLSNYLSYAQKSYIESIYYLDNNGKILFLYPKIANHTIDISSIYNYKSILQRISQAQDAKKTLYFSCSILNAEYNTAYAIMLVKPFFSPDSHYYGSIVEIINIQKKLDEIFSYIKDYSASIVYQPHRTSLSDQSSSEFIPLKLSDNKLYIMLNHNCFLKTITLKNIHDIMLNLLFMTVLALIIITTAAVILIKKSHKEIVQSKILEKLNKRIRMLEDAVNINEEYLSKRSIQKILNMANAVFDTNLSGIFLKQSKINYTFDGKTIKEIDYLSTEGSLSNYVWGNKRDIMVDDFEKASFISDKIKKSTKMRSSICAMISFKQHHYGVICIGNSKITKAFRQEDFTFLKLIAHNIASSLYRTSISNDITETLLNAIEARDSYTEGHSRRVGEYAKFIANIMGFDEEFQENILRAGLFHDVGKVGIPDIILLKPTKLSPNEYEIMKLHALFSYEILKNSEILKPVIAGIRGHHERWDAKGYPDGLAKDEIPITARILAIADSFDAITTLRPYKSAMNLEQTKRELERNAGTQFDPNIIEKILPHIDAMYAFGKTITDSKHLIFPKTVENARKNIFYTDWFSGLMTMEYLEETIANLVSKNIEFHLCRIDIVDYSYIRFKLGRKQASEIILTLANILNDFIGDEISRTPEDIFTFIVRGQSNPGELLNELIEKAKSKINYSLRASYISYPKDAQSINELIYKLEQRHKKAGFGKYNS